MVWINPAIKAGIGTHDIKKKFECSKHTAIALLCARGLRRHGTSHHCTLTCVSVLGGTNEKEVVSSAQYLIQTISVGFEEDLTDPVNNNTYPRHCPSSVLTDHKINRTLTQAHYTEAATPVDNQVAASLAPKSVEVISEMGVIARNAVGARAPLHRVRSAHHKRRDVRR